jgi:dihydrofolate synthase/folylpolyglutamate synthase
MIHILDDHRNKIDYTPANMLRTPEYFNSEALCSARSAQRGEDIPAFADCSQVLDYLDGLGLFHTDLSLERIRAALAALNLERPPFVTAQILGTNGKGSTSAFLASLCTAHGLRTGLYTSPHFVSPLERILVDGLQLPANEWLQAANILGKYRGPLTYFEWLTVLAALLFKRNNVEAAILEAGLGGRNDATTALAADVICYTPIAMDHKDILGNTLRRIAADKAAAIRGQVPVITVEQYPQAARCLRETAQRQGSPLYPAQPLPRDSPLKPTLAGPHQLINAGLALAAWRVLAPGLNREADNADKQKQGLRDAFLPGRMQAIAGCPEYPALLLDGAHNPHGMKALLEALDDAGIRPSHAVFSCLADKDWRPSAMMLKRFLGDVPVYIPPLNNPRAACAQETAEVWNSASPRTARTVESLSAALAALRRAPQSTASGPVLLTGSLYLPAEFLTLYPAVLTGVRNP